jgi:hypothetical protein
MTLILALAGVLMVWIRGVGTVEIWPLVSPFLFIALPLLAITSAVVVLFEMIGWLRGGFGNVVYFFGFGMTMPLFGEAMMGLSLVTERVGEIIHKLGLPYEGGLRLGVAAGIALVAAIFFDRFDPARGRGKVEGEGKKGGERCPCGDGNRRDGGGRQRAVNSVGAWGAGNVRGAGVHPTIDG